jgi:hypothetical protein
MENTIRIYREQPLVARQEADGKWSVSVGHTGTVRTMFYEILDDAFAEAQIISDRYRPRR